MKCLSATSAKRITLPFILCSTVSGVFADTVPSANVNITFENSLNPAFVVSNATSSTSDSQGSASSSLLSEYSSVLNLEYMNDNLSIKVGDNIIRPLSNVDGELDTSDPNVYAMMIQMPTISAMYKHAPDNNGQYYPDQQCVFSPEVMNIITFTQNNSVWSITKEETIPKQTLDIRSSNQGEDDQNCSNFNLEYALNVTPISGSQNEFNINFTFYISLNKNGVEALNQTNTQVSEANNPDYNVW